MISKAQLPIFDLHQDLLLHIQEPEHFPHGTQTGWQEIEDANVTRIIATAFPVPKDGNWYNRELNQKISEDFITYRNTIETLPDWSIILDRSTYASAKRGMILHIEGLNTIESLESDEPLLQEWYELGWRSLGLVWNKSNSLGGGTEVVTDDLTELGEKVIGWCLERGIIIDCAHMNRNMFSRVADMLESKHMPLLVSHGNADRVCESSRNFTDEQIVRIANSGGVIGVFFSGAYVSSHPQEQTLEKIVEHLEHIKYVGGSDVLALGTDFGGITKGILNDLERVERIQDLLSRLREKGWSDNEIEKLAYQNAERVVTKYLK